MLHVLSPETDKCEGKQYEKFLQICFQCYNILRANAKLLVNLFVLMVPAGIPELRDAGNVEYLVDQLQLQMSIEEAEGAIEEVRPNQTTSKNNVNAREKPKLTEVSFARTRCWVPPSTHTHARSLARARVVATRQCAQHNEQKVG